jgi:hypothetical protein
LYEQVDDGEDETGSGSENIIDLASSLLAECKAKLPLANLDTIVSLGREVLDRRPISHQFHSDAMRGLAHVLGVRFMYTNQINDGQESLTLLHKAFKHALKDASNVSTFSFYQTDYCSNDNPERWYLLQSGGL